MKEKINQQPVLSYVLQQHYYMQVLSIYLVVFGKMKVSQKVSKKLAPQMA